MKFLRDLSKPHYLFLHLNRKVDTIGVFGLEDPEKYHLTVMCNKKIGNKDTGSHELKTCPTQ